jgi:hypothetical protein
MPASATASLPKPTYYFTKNDKGKRIKVYRTARPNRLTETKRDYYKEAPARVAEVVGRVVGRNSFGKYHREGLFPVKKGEVYLEMHTWTEQPNVCTSVEYMDRFCYVLRYARREEGIDG